MALTRWYNNILFLAGIGIMRRIRKSIPTSLFKCHATSAFNFVIISCFPRIETTFLQRRITSQWRTYSTSRSLLQKHKSISRRKLTHSAGRGDLVASFRQTWLLRKTKVLNSGFSLVDRLNLVFTDNISLSISYSLYINWLKKWTSEK